MVKIGNALRNESEEISSLKGEVLDERFNQTRSKEISKLFPEMGALTPVGSTAFGDYYVTSGRSPKSPVYKFYHETNEVSNKPISSLKELHSAYKKRK
jgi:hypothetical protein